MRFYNNIIGPAGWVLVSDAARAESIDADANAYALWSSAPASNMQPIGAGRVSLTHGNEAEELGASEAAIDAAIAAPQAAFRATPDQIQADATIEANFALLRMKVPSGSPLSGAGRNWFGAGAINIGPDAPAPGDPNGFWTAFTALGLIDYDASGNPLDGQALGPPSIAGGAVVSAADGTSALAPGALISIYGQNLAPEAATTAPPLPTTMLRSTVVMAAGSVRWQIPLLYVSPTQINAQLPFDLPASAGLLVSTPAGNTPPVAVQTTTVAPRIFWLNPPTTVALLLHADNSLVTAQSPAHPGETVRLYAAGLGAVDPPLAAGAPAGMNSVVAPVTVEIGGSAAAVQYAGTTPGWAGLYQVTVTVPSGTSPGDASIAIIQAGRRSQDGVTIPIG